MSALIALITGHLGGILTGLALLGTSLTALFFHNSAQKAKADTVVAKQETAVASATLNAVTTKDTAVVQVSKIPDSDLDAEGKKLGIVRED